MRSDPQGSATSGPPTAAKSMARPPLGVVKCELPAGDAPDGGHGSEELMQSQDRFSQDTPTKKRRLRGKQDATHLMPAEPDPRARHDPDLKPAEPGAQESQQPRPPAMPGQAAAPATSLPAGGAVQASRPLTFVRSPDGSVSGDSLREGLNSARERLGDAHHAALWGRMYRKVSSKRPWESDRTRRPNPRYAPLALSLSLALSRCTGAVGASGFRGPLGVSWGPLEGGHTCIHMCIYIYV